MAKAGCEVYDVAELKLRWGVDKGTVAKKLKDPMFPAPIARGRWLKYLVHEWEVLRFRRISAHSESSGEIASGPDDLRL